MRTWDGGKSHLTKQVEEDKRVQRKRTADELLDEEMDKGKVLKKKKETAPHCQTFFKSQLIGLFF